MKNILKKITALIMCILVSATGCTSKNDKKKEENKSEYVKNK